MALIIKCRKCVKRIPETSSVCPFCGSAAFRFIVDYWPKGRHGGRKQITLPEKIQTAARAREMERDFMRPAGGHRYDHPINESKSSVNDLFPEYLRWCHLHRASSTWHDLSRTWENSLKEIFGSLDVQDIETRHYSQYQQFRAITVKHRTVNKELDYFSGFLRWCRREKKMDVTRIQYDDLPCSRPLPIVLSPDEVVRILAAEAEPVYHALLLCLYTMGLRISEARGLKPEDFDFENRCARVLQKGGTWKMLPISDQVAETVKKMLEQRKDKPVTYVFSVRKSGKPLQNIRKALARISERAKVTKKVNPHLFRHSLATNMLAADINLRTIQQYLGHSQISTTEFYTHVAMGHLRSAQKIVDLYGKKE